MPTSSTELSLYVTMYMTVFLNHIIRSRNLIAVAVLSVLLSGCEIGSADKDIDCQEEINAYVLKEIEDMEKLRSELKLEDVHDRIDRNGDGKFDLFYEYGEEFYFASFDRNFDGIVDEKYKYDMEDLLVSGEVDQDYDRVFETKIIYKDDSVRVVLSDTNKNGVFDVVTNFDYGVTTFSEKYYSLPEGSFIGKVKYSFEYPIGNEERIPTTITEKEFEGARKF